MQALAQWLNDAVKIPYIRMDTTFRDFISEQNLDWTHMPEVNSLSLHNEIPKVGVGVSPDVRRSAAWRTRASRSTRSTWCT